MSFDPIEVNPDPWTGIWLIVAMWSLPTILFVLQRQLPPSAPLRRYLKVAQWILVIGALPFSLVWLGLLDPTHEALRLGVIYLVSSLCLVAVVIAVFRGSRKRGSGGVV